jgi:hypothetical protein
MIARGTLSMRDEHPGVSAPRRIAPWLRALLLLLPLACVLSGAALAEDESPVAAEDESPAAAEDEESGEGDVEEGPTSASPVPEAATALVLTGSAGFEELGSLGQEDFRYTLDVRNPTDAALKIRAGNLLLAHEGGWLSLLDPDSFDGSFFRGTLLIPGGETVPGASTTYRSVTPATHTVLTLEADDGRAQLVTPIVREGTFAAPAAYTPPYPFGVGLVGPLEVVPFSDGEDAVLLVGQHQVLDGRLPSEVETSIVVGNDAGAGEPLRWSGLDASGDLTALWPFSRRIPVFSGFQSGVLQVSAKAVLDGKEQSFTGSWPVTRVQPIPMLTPLTGTWQLSNGPGGTDISSRETQPQERYAYDMVVLKSGRTHKGDPHLNQSYFAWERTIRAVADGEVVDICDHERDNPGYRNSLTQCFNNRVVIKHKGKDFDYYSAYLHIRKGSRARGLIEGREVNGVRIPGSKVRAGQPIAKVGNSGNSSEPHLHFQVFRIDETGRIRGVPVTFTNAFHDVNATRPVEGVALSGKTYFFRRK